MNEYLETLYLDVSEPLEDVIARAERRVENEARGCAEFTVTATQGGEQIAEWSAVRFVGEDGRLLNAEKLTVDCVGAGPLEIQIREPATGVILGRAQLSSGPLWRGAVVDVHPGSIRFGEPG